MYKKIGILVIVLIGFLGLSSCAFMNIDFEYSELATIKKAEQEYPKSFVKGPLRCLIIKSEWKEWRGINKLAEKYNLSELEVQRKFVEYIWAKRDTSIDTERNEFREQFYRNLIFVERKFQSGWNSDRGEIFLTFGPPDMWPVGIFTPTYQQRTEVQAWSYAWLGYEDLYEIYFSFRVPQSIFFVRKNSVEKWKLAVWVIDRRFLREYYISVWQAGIHASRFLTALERLKEAIREDYIYYKDLTFEDYLAGENKNN